MVTGVEGTTTGSQTSPKGANKALQDLSGDFENFLLLLTTQLKNQDPTQPLDTNQFTQQIVQLSGVEQAIATNKHLEDMMAMFGQNQFASLVSYIGKSVESDGNKGLLVDEVAYFAYDLASPAHDVSVSISDAQGNVVFTGQGTKNLGRNTVYWDGTNSFTSQKMPEGTYSFTVTAKDAGGQVVESKTYTTGLVTSVETKDGTSQLMLGDIAVPLDKVLAIRQGLTAG